MTTLGFFLFFDPMYILFVLLPTLAIAGLTQMYLKSAFAKGDKALSSTGMTGAQVAREILDANGLQHVPVEVSPGGHLSDHYDPTHKTVRLSHGIYTGTSLAALGVAAHEVGHAIQHGHGYAPLTIRNLAVPAANIGSSLSYIIILAGFFMNTPILIGLGIILFSAVVFFQLVNLPVEFNASTRARQQLLELGLVNDQEVGTVRKVLNAAALTYVGALVISVITLLYYVMIFMASRD